MSAVIIVVLFVGVVVALLVVGYVVSIYNSLVSLRRRVDQSKQNIDVLLTQRQEELTKLIDTVSEFMDHEEGLLTELTRAREQAEQASSPNEEAAADEAIKNVMFELDARTEDYPELRSNTNVEQLQSRISDIENQIADRREHYNEATTRYNTRIEQFPYVIFARQFGFQSKELFEASAEQKADVDVGEAFA